MARAAGVAVLLAGIAGCSGGQPDRPNSPDYDSAAAEETLVAALEAWKAGKAGSLRGRNPPVRFADDDHAAGARLTAYAVRWPDEPIRPFGLVSVELTLRTRDGRTIQRIVDYQVTLTPERAVIRSDS